MEEPAKDFSLEARYRTLARLLATESRVRAANNDIPGAVKSALEAHSLGMKVQQGGPLIAMLSGNTIELLARRELWTLLPKLDAATAKMAARHLEESENERFRFEDAVKVESEFGLLSLHKHMESIPLNQRVDFIAQVDAQWRKSMAGEIAAAKQPYIDSHQKPANADPDERLTYDPRSEMAGALPDARLLIENLFKLTRPALYSTRFHYERNAALNSLLATELARRAYTLDHKRDVTALTDLVPAYLQQVPADPFSNNQPLRFIEQEGKMVLYSIGPDGLDNWGMPIENETNRLNTLRLPNHDSFGDIVSSINTH